MFENISAKALIANSKMEAIILERYLSNAIPKSNKFGLEKACKYTGCNYCYLRNYINSNLYTISKDTINITDNTQLLLDKTKDYIERRIKRVICPEKYKNNKFVYLIAKLFDYSYFTEEEQKFIELMSNELFLIIDNNEISHIISFKDLIGFFDINHGPFLYATRQVYNDILQNKIYAGDNIMKYIKEYLPDIQITKKLENSYKYDYFFDNKGILKCDLHTHKNILIKNFLNTIIYGLNDNRAKILLLIKLNNKYPFLIK